MGTCCNMRLPGGHYLLMHSWPGGTTGAEGPGMSISPEVSTTRMLHCILWNITSKVRESKIECVVIISIVHNTY